MKERKMLKVVGLLLVFLCLVCFAACEDNNGSNGNSNRNNYSNGLSFTLNFSGKSYSVAGIGDCKDTDIYIPSTYNDLPVTSIRDSAFSGCSNLTSIDIPDSVMSIGDSAFSGCNQLIESENGVEYVDKWVVGYTGNPTTITLRENTVGIADFVFYECSSLTSIVMSDSVTHIGTGAFFDCSNLEYNSYDNGYYLGSVNNPYFTLVQPIDTLITTCEIHESTKIICESTFAKCSSLTNIVIPDSVKRIADIAFYGCNSLESIVIPYSVTSIGDSVFRACSSLTSITYNGTIEQWNAIAKGMGWNTDTADYTIHCTDGDIAKQ